MFISPIYPFSTPTTDKCRPSCSFVHSDIDVPLVCNAMGWKRQSLMVMATQFGDNAHISFHPLMFVYIIWSDDNLLKGTLCVSLTMFTNDKSWKWGSYLNVKLNTSPKSLAMCGSVLYMNVSDMQLFHVLNSCRGDPIQSWWWICSDTDSKRDKRPIHRTGLFNSIPNSSVFTTSTYVNYIINTCAFSAVFKIAWKKINTTMQ